MKITYIQTMTTTKLAWLLLEQSVPELDSLDVQDCKRNQRKLDVEAQPPESDVLQSA